MSCLGEIPKADAAIFADTGNEPAEVYRYLVWLKAQGEKYGIPVYEVSKSNLGEDTLAYIGGTSGSKWANLPVYMADEKGNPTGMQRRQCTGEYKIMPVRRKIRELLKERGEKSAALIMGISADETQRAKDSQVKYLTNEYPLIEKRMTRVDCLSWYNANGYPAPPRSACIFCPYRKDAEWKHLQENSPEEFAEAVEFDRKIRRMPGIKGTCYLHRSLQPLDQVDFGANDGQIEWGFQQECEGMCGI